MNESYVECLVAKKPSSAMKALQVFLIVLAVIFFLLSMPNALMWLGVAAAGIGAYFTSLNASVEFEYLYVDKEISVDKILNKTKRKKVEKFETESMEIFAPINSWHLDNMKNRQLKVTDYSSGVAGQPDRRYVMIYSGDRKIIFEPSEAMVKALQCRPKKICSTTRSRYILFRVRPFRFIFRVIPTSRCRAFLQLPRGVGNTADTD